MTDYLVYSLRMNAWVAKNGSGTSLPADAKRFANDEVIDYCKNGRDNDGVIVLIPVSVVVLNTLGAKL